jgi:hypothetical protein
MRERPVDQLSSSSLMEDGIFSFAGWDGVSLSLVSPGKSGEAGLAGALPPPGKLGGGTGMFAPTAGGVPSCGSVGLRGAGGAPGVAGDGGKSGWRGPAAGAAGVDGRSGLRGPAVGAAGVAGKSGFGVGAASGLGTAAAFVAVLVAAFLAGVRAFFFAGSGSVAPRSGSKRRSFGATRSIGMVTAGGGVGWAALAAVCS